MPDYYLKRYLDSTTMCWNSLKLLWGSVMIFSATVAKYLKRFGLWAFLIHVFVISPAMTSFPGFLNKHLKCGLLYIIFITPHSVCVAAARFSDGSILKQSAVRFMVTLPKTCLLSLGAAGAFWRDCAKQECYYWVRARTHTHAATTCRFMDISIQPY